MLFSIFTKKSFVPALFLFPLLAQGAKDCAQVEVSPGTTCEETKVEFDLSACSDGESAGEVEKSCLSSKGEARITTTKNSYYINLKSNEGRWGATEWVQDGRIHRSTVKASAEKKNHAEPAKKSKAAKTEARTVAAQENSSSASEAAPASSSGLQWKNWSINANIDTYYSYNFNKPNAVSAFGSTTPDQTGLRPAQNQYRYYDWYSRSINLNLAELVVRYKGTETALTIDLDFGQTAEMNAAQVTTANGVIPDEATKHIGQAVFSYTPAWAPRLSFDFGKMYTHVGLETAKAKDNWNYSRATLYSYGMPVWHVGMRAGYAITPDKLFVNGYYYTGWNTSYETNNTPTLGAQLKWVPNSKLNIVYNFIQGPEQAGNPANTNTLHDLNFVWQVMDMLAFQGDILAGKEQNASVGGTLVNATWWGASLAARLALWEGGYISPRYDHFRDQDGFRMAAGRQALRGFTLTSGHQLADGLEIRAEVRHDSSGNKTLFQKGNGERKGTQSTALLALLYSI